MEPIEGSETSAYNYQTPGKHPKEYIIKGILLLGHCDVNPTMSYSRRGILGYTSVKTSDLAEFYVVYHYSLL